MIKFAKGFALYKLIGSYKISTCWATGIPNNWLVDAAKTKNMSARGRARSHIHLEANRTDKLAAGTAILIIALKSNFDKRRKF